MIRVFKEKIEHIAIWSKDIERLKDFYIKYFRAKANDGYHNKTKGFRSYFLSFDDGSRLEIMNMDGILEIEKSDSQYLGYSHLAMNVGTKDDVIELTERIRCDGYEVVGEPRTTGDGYFESVILDPDGNRIEITC
ncbi:MAG: VOC family protein [Tissierellales bacterium]|jgi:lactoylglutathione lyase|nr:VOC family protein [Tissierellales bacterium]